MKTTALKLSLLAVSISSALLAQSSLAVPTTTNVPTVTGTTSITGAGNSTIYTNASTKGIGSSFSKAYNSDLFISTATAAVVPNATLTTAISATVPATLTSLAVPGTIATLNPATTALSTTATGAVGVTSATLDVESVGFAYNISTGPGAYLPSGTPASPDYATYGPTSTVTAAGTPASSGYVAGNFGTVSPTTLGNAFSTTVNTLNVNGSIKYVTEPAVSATAPSTVPTNSLLLTSGLNIDSRANTIANALISANNDIATANALLNNTTPIITPFNVSVPQSINIAAGTNQGGIANTSDVGSNILNGNINSTVGANSITATANTVGSILGASTASSSNLYPSGNVLATAPTLITNANLAGINNSSIINGDAVNGYTGALYNTLYTAPISYTLPNVTQQFALSPH